VVDAQGTESVQLGGTVSGTTVSGGGNEFVYSAASGVGDTIDGGGIEEVFSGGTALDATVLSGGESEVRSGGTASGTTVLSGGSINLPDLVFSGSQPVLSGMDLTVTEGADTYSQMLAGTYAGLNFVAAPDSGTGTLLTLEAAPCYATGTCILTDVGEVAIEALKPGDQVVLHDGRTEPVVWVGHRTVDCARHPDPAQVWPVRVAAEAFGPGLPHRDLMLSPDHAVFTHGVLIPIRLLINGTSIAQVKRDRITYCHVELPRHAVILAEGLPAESYLESGDRSNFHQDGGSIRLVPDFAARLTPDAALAWETRGAAPLVMTGEALAAARKLVEDSAPARSAEPASRTG
jgi:autotransporter passenger strand-loop-strand repeat protein